MNSASLLDNVTQQLDPETIQQMSDKVGADPAATKQAISMALPLLLGALSRNAATPQGAASLNSALDQHDGGILGNLGGILSGGGIGAAILGHVLGNRTRAVEEGVGRASGMNAQQVGQLLMMLAPIIMGVLGRMKKDQNIGAEQLPQVLERTNTEIAQKSPEAGGLSSILDKNNDGQIADDLARAGAGILGNIFSGRR